MRNFKKDDAHKEREKEKRKLAYEMKYGEHMKVLNKFKVSERFKTLAMEESEKETVTQRSNKERKVWFLTRKKREYERERIERKQDTVSKICKTVDTSDREIPSSYNREPRIYGGVKVSEEEIAALSLPPKYTTYEKINKQTAAVEIELMTAKYLWELNKEKEEDTDEVSECMNRSMSRPPSETNTRRNDRPSGENRRNVSSEEEVTNFESRVEENSTSQTRSHMQRQR